VIKLDNVNELRKCLNQIGYARAVVLPQCYENLYPVDKALWKGTIFEDLSMPWYSDISEHKHKREE